MGLSTFDGADLSDFADCPGVVGRCGAALQAYRVDWEGIEDEAPTWAPQPTQIIPRGG